VFLVTFYVTRRLYFSNASLLRFMGDLSGVVQRTPADHFVRKFA
jgi:hypothetical protein